MNGLVIRMTASIRSHFSPVRGGLPSACVRRILLAEHLRWVEHEANAMSDNEATKQVSGLENDCFKPLTIDPNPPHNLNAFSLILGLENTLARVAQRRVSGSSQPTEPRFSRLPASVPRDQCKPTNISKC
jgi:hypothetical protein